jgi:hypothetical protein
MSNMVQAFSLLKTESTDSCLQFIPCLIFWNGGTVLRAMAGGTVLRQ